MNRIPTAKEMSSNLAHLSNLLCQEELIQPDSKVYLDGAIGMLRKLGRLQSWKYTIEASEPIDFVPIAGKKLEQIAPRLYLTVAVKPQARSELPPFTRLVTVIEVWDILKNELQSRWHLDLANRKEDGSYQAGPLFHLQGGGHQPRSHRKEELKVSIPRWTTPPMELILTCEMIIANFYPDKWEKISTQKKWLELIHAAQQLCYPVYFQRVQNCLSSGGRRQSVLKTLWAKEWG
ncbi:MAG: hypothetical protein ABFS56_19050 [Pseudomonadota bacterium]